MHSSRSASSRKGRKVAGQDPRQRHTRNASQHKPDWDGTIHDLNTLRLSPKEQAKRHEAFKSKNRIAAGADRPTSARAIDEFDFATIAQELWAEQQTEKPDLQQAELQQEDASSSGLPPEHAGEGRTPAALSPDRPGSSQGRYDMSQGHSSKGKEPAWEGSSGQGQEASSRGARHTQGAPKPHRRGWDWAPDGASQPLHLLASRQRPSRVGGSASEGSTKGQGAQQQRRAPGPEGEPAQPQRPSRRRAEAEVTSATASSRQTGPEASPAAEEDTATSRQPDAGVQAPGSPRESSLAPEGGSQGPPLGGWPERERALQGQVEQLGQRLARAEAAASQVQGLQGQLAELRASEAAVRSELRAFVDHTTSVLTTLQAQWSRLILAQDVGATAHSVASAAWALSEVAGEGPAGRPSLPPAPAPGQLQLPAPRDLSQAAVTSSGAAGEAAANTGGGAGAGGGAASPEPPGGISRRSAASHSPVEGSRRVGGASPGAPGAQTAASREPQADCGDGGAAGGPPAGFSGGGATSPEPLSGFTFEHAEPGSVADTGVLDGDGAPLQLVQPSALRQRSWPRPPRDSPGQPASQPLGPGFAAVSLSGPQPGGRLAGGPGGAFAPATGPQLQVDSPPASGGSKAGTGSAAAGTLAEEAGLPSFSALLPRSPSSPFEPRVRSRDAPGSLNGRPASWFQEGAYQENEARAGPLAPHLKALGMPVLRHHAQPLQASPLVNTFSNLHRPMASPAAAAMSCGPPASESLSLAHACRPQQSKCP